MTPAETVVLASGNAGKLAEFETLFAPIGIRVVPQREFGVADAAEPWPSFVGNALAKARHASRQTGLPALADDSGLCVVALDGAPGVMSARFSAAAGGAGGDEANNARLLSLLDGVTDRRAYFHCALVLVRHPDDPRPIVAEGSWHGAVASSPSGKNGFGYDVVFVPAGETRTAAELTATEKNAISHRARALADLVERLRAEAVGVDG
jgi:XTP/dITP diphosphohydrolase